MNGQKKDQVDGLYYIDLDGVYIDLDGVYMTMLPDKNGDISHLFGLLFIPI